LNCTSGQSVIRDARSRVGVVLQAAGARPGGGKRVARVEHGARLHREASAADAAGQLVLESLESMPALLELLLPRSGCALPILMARRAIQRHRVEHILHALERDAEVARDRDERQDRKSTRLNSSHVKISYAVFCLKKKKKIRCEKGAAR